MSEKIRNFGGREYILYREEDVDLATTLWEDVTSHTEFEAKLEALRIDFCYDLPLDFGA